MKEDKPEYQMIQRVMGIVGKPITLPEGESLDIVLGKMGLVKRGERVGDPREEPAKWYMTVQPAEDIQGNSFYFGAVVFDMYTQDPIKEDETRRLPFSRDRYERAMELMKEYTQEPKMVIVTMTPTDPSEAPDKGNPDRS